MQGGRKREARHEQDRQLQQEAEDSVGHQSVHGDYLAADLEQRRRKGGTSGRAIGVVGKQVT